MLFSGRIPIKVTPRSLPGLVTEIASSRSNLQDYLASLATIRDLKPNLWLPSSPIDGQNANLYDDEWIRVIDENRDAARFVLSRARLK